MFIPIVSFIEEYWEIRLKARPVTKANVKYTIIGMSLPQLFMVPQPNYELRYLTKTRCEGSSVKIWQRKTPCRCCWLFIWGTKWFI